MPSKVIFILIISFSYFIVQSKCFPLREELKEQPAKKEWEETKDLGLIEVQAKAAAEAGNMAPRPRLGQVSPRPVSSRRSLMRARAPEQPWTRSA